MLRDLALVERNRDRRKAKERQEERRKGGECDSRPPPPLLLLGFYLVLLTIFVFSGIIIKSRYSLQTTPTEEYNAIYSDVVVAIM